MKLALACATLCLAVPLKTIGAPDVDAALGEIAVQIIERTVARIGAATPPTIAVSTFTHGDGSCSQLSNYATEFVVDSLFNAGDNYVEIIERSQLSAIFRELELVYDGTIAPSAAQRVGEISGVDALITGSLIEFGEVVKLQARLISSADGKLFATARSEFPVVGTIGQMMVGRSRENCGFVKADGEPIGSPGSGTKPSLGSSKPAQITPASSMVHESDVFLAAISSAIYSQAAGEISFAIRFQNTSDNSIGLSYLPKTISATDGNGGFMNLSDDWSGLRTCYSENRPELCNATPPPPPPIRCTRLPCLRTR